MKIACSTVPLAILISACTLSGCVSDKSSTAQIQISEQGHIATVEASPSGIWLINSRMTEDVNQAGEEFHTEAESKQLVVIEAIGNNQYQLHECSLGGDVHYPAPVLELQNSTLQAASSFTDYDSLSPYNESEKIDIRLYGEELHGIISSYDRNLDGSYDGRQVAYFEGVKISEAQTLAAITEQEITALLGSDINRYASTENRGQTCAGIANIETNGTQRTAELGSAEIAKLINPEPQPSIMVTAEMVASGETN